MSFKSLLFILFLLNTSLLLQGQFTVEGTIQDSLAQPLSGASVSLLYPSDSTLASFAFSDDDGQFIIEDIEVGTYIMSISYIGYGTFQSNLSIENKNINFGKITLNPLGVELEGVEVKADFIPIVIKKDTIEYHADAFKTKKNAVVEDLLKKLPGVEVDKDGTIKAQGKEVQNILVDGEEFFGKDTKIASKNIPSEIVEKVQVYDKKSEISELTGVDDGVLEKTINLKIKEGKKKGWFGNVSGGYTPDNHYLAGGMLNRFSKKTQFSALANANDINEQLFSIMDYIQFDGGLNSLSSGSITLDNLPGNLINRNGITDAQSGGINVSHKFSKHSKLSLNSFIDNSNNKTTSASNGITLLEEEASQTITQSQSEETAKSYRFKAKFKHKFNEKSTLIANSNFIVSEFGTNTNNEESFSFNSNLLRASDQYSIQKTKNFDSNNKLLYAQKLNKIGRSFSLSAIYRLVDSNYDGDINNQSLFYINNEPSLNDTVLQSQEQIGKQNIQNISLYYTEPIGLNWNFSPYFKWNNQERESRQYFYDLENGKIELSDLFSDYDRTIQNLQLGANVSWAKKKWSTDIVLGFQQFKLSNQMVNNISLANSDFNYFKPSASIKYHFSNSKTIRFNYNTKANLPNLKQLQPVIDNTNPNFIYQGNPLLQPSFSHSINLSYNSFNQFYGRSLMLRIDTRLTQNSFITQRVIDDNLVTIAKPTNGGDTWRSSFYGNYSMAIKPWGIKWKTTQNLNYSNNIFNLNGLDDNINTTIWDCQLAIENRYQSKIAAELGFGFNLNQAHYKKNNQYNRSLNTQQVFTDISWFLKEDWEFSLANQYKWFNDKTLQPLHFLDLSVSHFLLDGQLALSLEGNNLLGEDNIFEQNAFENNINTSTINRLGRYFLLKFNYKFRQFGK